jgi:hypothetical protein
MGHAMPLQRGDRRHQVVTVATEQFQTGDAFLPQQTGQRFVARLLKHQHGAARHLQFVMDGNDELAVDRAQGLGFVVQSSVVVFGQGDLQDELLIVLRDEQGLGRGSLAEFLLDDVAPFQSVATLGLQRIGERTFPRERSVRLRHRPAARGSLRPSRLGCSHPGEYTTGSSLPVRPTPSTTAERLRPFFSRRIFANSDGCRPAAGKRTGGRRSLPARRRPRLRSPSAGRRSPRGTCRRTTGFHQVLDVGHAAESCAGITDADLPVVDLERRRFRVGLGDQNALRPRGPGGSRVCDERSGWRRRSAAACPSAARSVSLWQFVAR